MAGIAERERAAPEVAVPRNGVMAEEEARWGQLMAELGGIRDDVKRIEKRIDKDADELYERVRILEITTALAKQAMENEAAAVRRNFAIIAAAVGSGGGAAVSLLSKLF